MFSGEEVFDVNQEMSRTVLFSRGQVNYTQTRTSYADANVMQRGLTKTSLENVFTVASNMITQEHVFLFN